jgi:hypothetical protein
MTNQINHRARKLEAKGIPYLVVGQHEPYAGEVYRIIREHEQSKGAWTDEDEGAMDEFLFQAWFAQLEGIGRREYAMRCPLSRADWRCYYDQGLTPAQAWTEDFSNA